MVKVILMLCISLGCFSCCNAKAKSFEEKCLEEHNKYREMHGVPPLVLDDEVQAHAQSWADHLANIGYLSPKLDRIYGENLFAVNSAKKIWPSQALRSWYKHIRNFNWEKPSPKRGYPFVNIVWKKSQRLGCAMARNGTKAFVVANYDPRGNHKGSLKCNVPKKIEPKANAQNFEESCLQEHNKYREMHGVPPMVLDDEIQEHAKFWAEHLMETGAFRQNPDMKYGENLYLATPVKNITGYQPIRAWYADIENYDWENPNICKGSPFARIIKKKSERLGCAMVRNGSTIIVVANYDPRGNEGEDFVSNVSKKIELNC